MTTTAAVPRLTLDAEEALARTIEAGIVAAEALTRPRDASLATDSELTLLVAEGEAARETLMLANTGLVVTIARAEARWDTHSIDELVQEGFVGLALALTRYDYRRGPFGTYASSWVRRTVRAAALTRCGTTEMSVKQATSLAKVRRAEAELQQVLGRDVGVDDVLTIVGGDRTLVAQRLGYRAHTPLDDLPEIADETSTEDIAEHNQRVEVVQQALDHLPPFERTVLLRRYGFMGEPATRAVVAEELGCACTTVRRAEARAIGIVRGFLAGELSAA